MTNPAPLVRQLTHAVHTAPGGGLHREELAETLGLRPYAAQFTAVLMAAYRQGEIDFCGQYVVAPARDTPVTG